MRSQRHPERHPPMTNNGISKLFADCSSSLEWHRATSGDPIPNRSCGDPKWADDVTLRMSSDVTLPAQRHDSNIGLRSRRVDHNPARAREIVPRVTFGAGNFESKVTKDRRFRQSYFGFV
jgi:hypothetical protein